ncbi:MAG: hypothetical protein JJT76_00590 [Clostridiaceae bacterium]|nr:hypothetical protein [Clostridiaceae bacterium]
MKKVACLILVLSLLAISLFGCSSSNSIVGKWGNDELEFEFLKNGDGVLRQGNEITLFEYKALSDTELKLTVKMDIGEETEIVDYSIENNILTTMDLELKRK